ncbi:hypothetical protein A0257_10430 [Hymenobacter psoromatis]|nr:hypothetical protein A0257_10430 [Hymenobacter psoromatis]
MRSHSLLLAACLSLPLAAFAQRQPGPAYFLRHPTQEPRPGLVLLPGGPVPALPAAPLPTVRAAAALVPPLAAAGPPTPPVPADEPRPRHDLTGVWAYPPYNSYQNLPEAYRKHPLPDAWAEPLFLQLLRGALGR